jgi:hypothetical protein
MNTLQGSGESTFLANLLKIDLGSKRSIHDPHIIIPAEPSGISDLVLWTPFYIYKFMTTILIVFPYAIPSQKRGKTQIF